MTPASVLGVTPAKLETFFAPAELAKLTDIRHKGVPWAEFVAQEIEFASSWVLSIAGVQVKQASLVAREDLVLFAGFAVRKAAIGCWNGRALGELPANLQRLNAELEQWANNYVERRRTPALDPEADPAHPMELVDFDPDNVKVTQRSMRGFW